MVFFLFSVFFFIFIVLFFYVIVNFKGFSGRFGFIVRLREQGGELGDTVDELREGGCALVERCVVDGFHDAVGEDFGDGEQFIVEGLEGFGGFGRENP